MEGSSQRGCEQIWRGGAQADLERLLLTEGGASAGATGRCPRDSGQGGRRAELSKNEGSEGGDRAGGAWGHSSNRRRGRTDLFEVLRNHSCALQKTDSKWGRVSVDTSEEASRIIEVRDDGGQGQSENSGNGEMGSHSRHMLKAESKKPADRMGVGCRRRGDCGVWGEEGEGQGLHLLSWGRWWRNV